MEAFTCVILTRCHPEFRLVLAKLRIYAFLF